MLLVDQSIRDEIIKTQGNIVIGASAGTGKTYTTIQKIKYDSETNSCFRTFAAITFTRKAAREILERLGTPSSDAFVGTNDNFILYEIINPFMYDAFGDDFKKEIKPDYTEGNRVRTYEEGIEKIETYDLMCKYFDKKKNFAFQLALDILRKSKAARRYLKAKYYRIYIDEYQDSDKDMNRLFMFLCHELEIPLFIVGDQKQSIYSWRGAYSIGFTNLFCDDKFKNFKLWHNFRSNVAIQNYSNIFMDDVRENVVKTDFSDEVTSYRYLEQNKALAYIKKWIDENEKCSILHRSNNNARFWANALSQNGLDFVYIPTPELEYSNIETEHTWIARALASYLMITRYSELDFFSEIPMPEGYDIKVIKKLLKTIMKKKASKLSLIRTSKKVYEYLGYKPEDENVCNELELLHKVISDDAFVPYYNADKFKLTSGTIHSAKGLEYNQVIIFGNDYNFSRDEDRFLHYVAVSRAEERLLVLLHGGPNNQYASEVKRVVNVANEIGIDIDSNDLINKVKTKNID